jgi:hypothetical protein
LAAKQFLGPHRRDSELAGSQVDDPWAPVRPVLGDLVDLIRFVLPPPSSKSDQYSCAYGDRERGQGAMLDLYGNPMQRIVANSGADPECLIAQARRLITRQPSTITEAVDHFAQDRGNSIAHLIAGRQCGGGGAPASSSSDFLKLLLKGA